MGYGDNLLQTEFWILNFEKNYGFLSPKILNFYDNFNQNTGLLQKIFVEVQYFETYKFYRNP